MKPHAIAPYIARIARGKHGSEHLSQSEARDVFTALLHADASPLQLGAFLIAQRMKGETAEELAGFTQAARHHSPAWGEHSMPANTIDMPCYAGKCRATALHLLAALHVSKQYGIPVIIHGIKHVEGRLSAWDFLQGHVRRASSIHEAASMVQTEGIAYLDISDASPALHRLLSLREILGVRSFANTIARLLNPLNAAGQINGVFHTPYVERMAAANIHLSQPRSLIFMGAEGEPELYADRQKQLCWQHEQSISWLSYASASDCEPYPKTSAHALACLQADFERLQTQPESASLRERSTLARMQQAICSAAGQALEPSWSIYA